MKKSLILLLALALLLSICGCGSSAVVETVEITYLDSYKPTSEVLDKYDTIEWASDHPEIADVTDGAIVGYRPGSAVITAQARDKTIATYNVTVNIKEITGIVFATNTAELSVGDELTIEYTLFPDDASEYGLTWKSADPTVAMVDDNGKVTAILPGQTSVTLSTENGVVAIAAISVKEKEAYEQLSEKEQNFVDAVLSVVNQFKNPGSVKILGIQEMGGTWYVNLSASNSFGGTVSETYWLFNDLIYQMDVTVKHDDSYNLTLINQAIKDKQG